MIVKCEQCQTRFKIPDDKVTEKGVKVRCTKCQHTFRVKKEGEPTSPAAAPADPFSRFGAPPAPEPGEQTRPGMYAMGVKATKTGELPPLTPSFAAQADLPAEAFESPTRVGPLPSAPGRMPAGAPAPFDFSALPPAPGAQAQPPPRPAPKSSAGFDPQPFDFSSLGAVPAAPSEVTQRATNPGAARPSSFEPQPFDFSALSAPPAEPAKTEVTRRERVPQRASTFEPQPFDFSSLGGDLPPETTQQEPLRAPLAAPPPSTFEPQPFDFSSLGSEALPPPPPPPRQAPPSRPPPSQPPPRQSAPPPRSSPSGAVTQVDTRTVSPPHSSSSLLDDIPMSDAALSIDSDDGLEASHEARGSLFDMSSVPESNENQLQPAAEPQEQVAVAKIALKKVSAEQLAKARTEGDEGQVSSRRVRRNVVATVWNLLSGAVLLALVGVLITVVLNGGKVDAALSWSRFKSLFSKPLELVAFDISNGLYDTRAGRPVFYVRGEVKNRGTHSGRVRVKAEILDGEELVQAAEGFAGATPSPEDLYAVTTAEDLTKLSTRLAPTAVQLKPGSESSFLVAFYEYPPDLKDFRVRVTASPDDGTTAAR